jgi:hypothetical protein
MPTPKGLKELQGTINEELLRSSLPEIRIDGFRHPDQALEITFERETLIGENRERLWGIINILLEVPQRLGTQGVAFRVIPC